MNRQQEFQQTPRSGLKRPVSTPVNHSAQTQIPINKIFNGNPNAAHTPGTPSQTPHSSSKKKKKVTDKTLPSKIREYVPECATYMDLLEFEKKLDYTLMKKQFDIQEALKKPIKQKRTLRLFISNSLRNDTVVPSWELSIEGRLLDEKGNCEASTSKTPKRLFTSFFKSLVIVLDKDLYGPDNYVTEWHRNIKTSEMDGFRIKRTGDKNVQCKIYLLLNHQPQKFKLDERLARVLSIHTATRSTIYTAIWEYIKKHGLQDVHEREYFKTDMYLEQIFGIKRIKFSEFPQLLSQYLFPPDPIVIDYLINIENNVENNHKAQVCTDVEVELEDNLKQQMSWLTQHLSNANEISQIDTRIDEIVEKLNQLKANREFFLSFSHDPQTFIYKWLASQSRDLKAITGQSGVNPDEERSSEFYYEPWIQEAVPRYVYGKIQEKRIELEKLLGIHN